MPNKGKRSPLKEPNLPQAGDSLHDAAIDLLFDRFLPLAISALAAIGIGIAEMVMGWLGITIRFYHWIVVGLIFAAFSVWRWFQIRPQLEQIILGRRGEREVGRTLEEARALGYKVFHDIPGNGFNVDHVLIGPGGVFAIETKTISKPTDHNAQITYDGEKVLVDGHTPDRDPVAQAQACASYIADILRRKTDRTVFVRPVVLYPGWWVNQQPKGCKTWVLEPKRFLGYLRNEPKSLMSEDVALYADRLREYLTPLDS